MPYALGIDLGTTYSAAAVADASGTTVLELGTHNAAVPSVAFLRPDGVLLVGESAERRGINEPERMARDFKRRFGDPTPILLGGTPYGAEALMAHLLHAIVDVAEKERGEKATRIVVTHPASYGPYKLELMNQVVRLAGLTAADFLTEPAAAAIHYASTERVAPGEFIAVYDLGGGTFDAAVVRKLGVGFDLVGEPEGLERFGGIDLDHAVFGHVSAVVGDAIATLPGDPIGRAALAQLRQSCRSAKEALSTDTDASVSVMLPTRHTDVRITRVEFEAMIRPRVTETVDVLERAIASADLTVDQISRVLLVGGCSRIPLVAESIRASTRRPVALDANPKHAIALGAAAFGFLALQSEVPARPIAINATVAQPQPAVWGSSAALMTAAARRDHVSSGSVPESAAQRSSVASRMRLPRLALPPLNRAVAVGVVLAVTASGLILGYDRLRGQAAFSASSDVLRSQHVPSSTPLPAPAVQLSELQSSAPTTPTSKVPSIAPAVGSAPPVTTPAPARTTAARGSVTWNGSGVDGMHVILFREDGLHVATSTSDGNGVFRFTNIPAGTYRIDVDWTIPSEYLAKTYRPAPKFVESGTEVDLGVIQMLKSVTGMVPEGGAIAAQPVTLRWLAFPQAATYVVDVYEGRAQRGVTRRKVASAQVTANQFVAPQLLTGEQYFWEIEARNDANVPVAAGFANFIAR